MTEEREAYQALAGDALKALLQDRPIAYHPILAHAFGSVTAALFLSQLLYWTPRAKDPDGWVYKTQVEMASETGLSRREQQTARLILRRSGVLAEQRKGIPARLYFQVNFCKLSAILAGCDNQVAQNRQSGMHETCNLDAQNRQSIPETTTEITTETTPPLLLDPRLKPFQDLRGFKNSSPKQLQTLLQKIEEHYSHVDLEEEALKMEAWLDTPKGKNAKATPGRILTWLGRIGQERSNGNGTYRQYPTFAQRKDASNGGGSPKDIPRETSPFAKYRGASSTS